jgi:hypothetical protein
MARAAVATKPTSRGAAQPEPSKKQQPEETQPAAAPIEKRTFSFDIEEGLEIPAAALRAPVAHELPFKRMFDKMTKHGQSFWLPTSFWTLPVEAGGRGVEAEKADSTYVRGKVRNAFNQWKKADDTRANRDIQMVPRAKGDNNGKGGVFEEEGFTVFMLIH